MTDPVNSPAAATVDAAASGDFIDFYQLLEVPFDVTTTQLRHRVNELYTEAQRNRDHRNISKRRRYEALCELLPYCRIVLLDAGKRARYDRYREQVTSGAARVLDFESLMNELVSNEGESGDSQERISLPGIENDDAYLPVSVSASSRTSKAPRAAAASRGADGVILTGAAGQPRQLSKAARDSLIGSVFSMVLFTGVFVVVWLLVRDLSWAILPASLAGIINWIVVHRKPASNAMSTPGQNRISS